MPVFGKKEIFSIEYRLVPYPYEDFARNPDWGEMNFWVNGEDIFIRKTEGHSYYPYEYNLFYIFYFFCTNMRFILDEKAFPLPIQARTGLEFSEKSDIFEDDFTELAIVMSEDPKANMWCLKSNGWCCKNGFISNEAGSFLPNAYFRKIGNQIEISWWNKAGMYGRSDLVFKSREGTSYIDVELFIGTVESFVNQFYLQFNEPFDLNSLKLHFDETMKAYRNGGTYLKMLDHEKEINEFRELFVKARHAPRRKNEFEDLRLKDRLVTAIGNVGLARLEEFKHHLYFYLNDPSPYIRGYAIESLGYSDGFFDPEFKDRAYQIWKTDPDEIVRATALVAWVEYHVGTQDPKALKILYDILTSKKYSVMVRKNALCSLLEVSGMYLEDITKIMVMGSLTPHQFEKAVEWDKVNHIMDAYVPGNLVNFK